MACLNCNCGCRCLCNIIAIIAGIVIGVVTAFLQISGVLLITTTFLWVVFGIAVGFIALLLAASVLARTTSCTCVCRTLNTVLIGALGAVLFSVVLLAVGITATSVTSAVLAGLVLGFFTLTLSGAACLARCLANCCDE